MRRLEFAVTVLVEAENDLRPLDHDRPPDQVGVLDHHRDRLLLRLRQRPFLEHRTARAHIVEEVIRLDVFLEELARRRFLVDVHLLNRNRARIQKTSGVFARGSGGLRVEGRFRHAGRIVENDPKSEVPVTP